MGSGGARRLNTFVGFSCWICRTKSLQPGMHNLNSLLKSWVREADWGRRGDEARCSIFTVQPCSAWLPFPRCVGCKPHFWILLPRADLLVWIMPLRCFVEGSQRHLSLHLIFCLLPGFPLQCFFCKAHALAAFWHHYRFLCAGTPLPKKMWVVT